MPVLVFISEIIYLLVIKLYGISIFVSALFIKKAKQWVTGRQNQASIIRELDNVKEKRILFHCPSLGEYEQGRPVLEALRKEYPDHKIVLTFFSPSGYEMKKNHLNADYVFYLPLDGPFNSPSFIRHVNPQMAFFVKYDFWHYYIKALKDKKIPCYYISCIFRPGQMYFKWYGVFMEKILQRISHLFVQNQHSLEILYNNSITNVTVSGDTRFDRVYQNSMNIKKLNDIEQFKQDRKILIAGSTWADDEKIIAEIINQSGFDCKYIIVPHEINKQHIDHFVHSLKKKAQKYSDFAKSPDYKDDVLVIDNIGMLSSLYSYANVAYIGGGFGKGIHNILEAAVFGLPVFFGPGFKKFNEAKELIHLGGAFSIKNSLELQNQVSTLLNDAEKLSSISSINRKYINDRKGATDVIMNFLRLNH